MHKIHVPAFHPLHVLVPKIPQTVKLSWRKISEFFYPKEKKESRFYGYAWKTVKFSIIQLYN